MPESFAQLLIFRFACKHDLQRPRDGLRLAAPQSNQHRVGPGRLHGRDQFLGRRVGQAEHGDVGRLGDLGALAEVLAVGHRQLEQLDVRPVLQPVEDLQASGAVLAVDENLGLVAGHCLLSRKFRAFETRPAGEGS